LQDKQIRLNRYTMQSKVFNCR